jgi:hypothetical protein
LGLVRGRQHDRVGVSPQRLVQPNAPASTPDPDRVEAGAGSDHRVLGVARVLERNPARAGRRRRAAHQTEALGVAAGHGYPVGICDDAADAAEVHRERRARSDHSARIAVAKIGIGHRVDRLARRS